jgi:hypothetical protein
MILTDIHTEVAVELLVVTTQPAAVSKFWLVIVAELELSLVNRNLCVTWMLGLNVGGFIARLTPPDTLRLELLLLFLRLGIVRMQRTMSYTLLL